MAEKRSHGPTGAPSSIQLEGAPWFDLAIYRDVPNWTAKDWVRAVQCRLAVPNTHEMGASVDPRRPSHWDCLKRDCIRGNGFCHSASSDPPLLFGGQDGPLSELPLPGDGRLEEALSCVAQPPENALLAIDLAASDQALKSSFADWLKRKRNAVPLRQIATADDIKNWANSRVIAYIDIQLWSESIGRQFDSVEIQAALFADHTIDQKGRVASQILSRSTIPYAAVLRDQRNFDRMVYQIGGIGL